MAVSDDLVFLTGQNSYIYDLRDGQWTRVEDQGLQDPENNRYYYGPNLGPGCGLARMAGVVDFVVVAGGTEER